MSTDGRTRTTPVLALAVTLAVLGVLVPTGLLLQRYGPGDMGVGLLQGGAVGLVVAGVLWWRASRRPRSTTTLERAWTQTGDERDDTVLTRALAVVGMLAFPLTGVTAIAIGFGADVFMMLTLLLLAEVAVGAVAFAVTDRRS